MDSAHHTYERSATSDTSHVLTWPYVAVAVMGLLHHKSRAVNSSVLFANAILTLASLRRRAVGMQQLLPRTACDPDGAADDDDLPKAAAPLMPGPGILGEGARTADCAYYVWPPVCGVAPQIGVDVCRTLSGHVWSVVVFVWGAWFVDAAGAERVQRAIRSLSFYFPNFTFFPNKTSASRAPRTHKGGRSFHPPPAPIRNVTRRSAIHAEQGGVHDVAGHE